MNTLDVHLRLHNLRCYDEGDGIGSAEPYLWTVFFKIDGDTTFVDPSLTLRGTATVIGTPGNHGNLPNHSVDGGENVPIPPAIGERSIQLKPIPLQQPVGDITEVGGVIGMIAVLMEEDNTPGSAIAKGHAVLDKAVLDALNELIPTLDFAHREPTEEEIEALKKKVGDAVTDAIEDAVSFGDWLGGLGNMDDKIGSEVFRFSHAQLEAFGVSGLSMRKRFRSGGDWELNGRASALPVDARTGSLRVTISGIPSTVTVFPVRVTGPGFNRSIGRTATLSGLLPGAYTVSANPFDTGAPGKPTCRIHTPVQRTVQTTVVAGQTASASVRYIDEPCEPEEPREVVAADVP